MIDLLGKYESPQYTAQIYFNYLNYKNPSCTRQEGFLIFKNLPIALLIKTNIYEGINPT